MRFKNLSILDTYKMTLKLSIILCTYNPRMDYMKRTLESIAQQTLANDQWELILIDNNSKPSLSGIALPNSGNARVVCEHKQGLTMARLRGIQEASGELLLFVDDDNVLNADYFEQVLEIARTHPFLGAWGGSTPGDFEVPVPEWMKPHLAFIGVRHIEESHWSNIINLSSPRPIGAGMAVRRSVASFWSDLLETDEVRRGLDRMGEALGGSGDTDLAFTSTKMGLGFGVFKELSLQHLIPAERLEYGYFMRLVEGTMCSANLLLHAWGQPLLPEGKKRSWKGQLLHRVRSRNTPEAQLEYLRVYDRGLRRGGEIVSKMNAVNS
jgi:glycosyltransferase involved in cell wall biosynthesis